MAHTPHAQLTTENAAAAVMPQGLHYAARVDWLQKRDMLRRVASAAPVVVASADEVALREVENQCGVDYFDKLDSLQDVAAAAPVSTKRVASTDDRWVRASLKAAVELATGALSFDGGMLVVKSRTSNRLYRCTAAKCDCTAFAHNAPCWHRAAARLIIKSAA